MGKRSEFPRRPRDYYPTPAEAVEPLRAHLPRGCTFWEPCAGDGALIRALDGHALCVQATDIEPQRGDILCGDLFDLTTTTADYIITNPPWPMPGQGGDPVISLIRHLSAIRPTWLLLPWNFHANRYARKVATSCVKVVPIGRVSWMGNGTPGKDDSAWSLWDAKHTGQTALHPRP